MQNTSILHGNAYRLGIKAASYRLYIHLPDKTTKEYVRLGKFMAAVVNNSYYEIYRVWMSAFVPLSSPGFRCFYSAAVHHSRIYMRMLGREN